MTRLRSSQLVALGIAWFSASCSQSMPEPLPGEGDRDVRIDTPATELMARVTFGLPAGTCLPGETCATPLAYAPRITVDETSIALLRQYRFTPGEHVLEVDGYRVPLQLALGPARTLTLPVAMKRCEYAATSTTGPLSFGPWFEPTFPECPPVSQLEGGTLVPAQEKEGFRFHYYSSNCVGSGWRAVRTHDECRSYEVLANWEATQLGDRCQARRASSSAPATLCRAWFYGLDLPTVIPPTTLGFRIGTESALTQVPIAEGEIKDVVVRLPQTNVAPPLWKLALDLRGAVELPTSSAGTLRITSACGNDYVMPETHATGLGAQTTWELRAAQHAGCSFQLTAGGRTLPLAQQDATVTLHRLDLSYPIVTREDGSTYRANDATFSIYHQGRRTVAGLPTGTGLYVLPGQYEVVVEFRTQIGPQTVRHQVSF